MYSKMTALISDKISNFEEKIEPNEQENGNKNNWKVNGSH